MRLISESEAMNLLQGAGIISDECVLWTNVADSDKAKALLWFKDNGYEFIPRLRVDTTAQSELKL